MELDRKDRLILINQFLILEKLYPDEARHYSISREALENGYKREYESMLMNLDSEMSRDHCDEVWDILDMFSFLQRCYEGLGDKEGISSHDLRWVGFDGNNETEQMAYASYIIHRLDRFKEFEHVDVNSHMQVLGSYRRMLHEWKRSNDKYRLSKEDIIRIAAARQYPE